MVEGDLSQSSANANTFLHNRKTGVSQIYMPMIMVIMSVPQECLWNILFFYMSIVEGPKLKVITPHGKENCHFVTKFQTTLQLS